MSVESRKSKSLKLKSKGQALPGTKLSKEEMLKVTHQIARPQAKYAWSAGPAMARFLKELKAGRIIGRKCHRCARVLVPPRMFCELCFRPTDSWVYLPDTGIIETFSISYIDKDANRLKEPLLVGVVALDKAPPHCGFMHYLSEVSLEKLRIGMPVEAVWKNEEEREGSILDIKYFRPRKKEDRLSHDLSRKTG